MELKRMEFPFFPVLAATIRSVLASRFCLVVVGLLELCVLCEVSMKGQGVLNAGLFMYDCVIKVRELPVADESL